MDLSSSGLSPSAGGMALQQMQRESSNYQIEPFSLPGQRSRLPSAGSDHNGEPQHAATPTTGAGGGNIYVVHHDGGRAPVTVYHQDGTEVVELPPRYAHGSASSDGPSEQQVSSTATERRTSSPSVQDILTPQRRPNRPGKP